ncbi:hypothetical protein K0B04_04120 [Patescibacteria group bacterium]|nr:hypothetical protein [Patescibacteria group bacterium]
MEENLVDYRESQEPLKAFPEEHKKLKKFLFAIIGAVIALILITIIF